MWLQILIPTINKNKQSKANQKPSIPNAIHNAANGSAGNVPKVPGALGAKPVPKPKPSKHIGRFSNQENVGLNAGICLTKMIKSFFCQD